MAGDFFRAPIVAAAREDHRRYMRDAREVHGRSRRSAVPKLEPGHRPTAAPPPAPPRRQALYQPEPTAAFLIQASRAQLRHPRTAAITDLHPDNATRSPDRDRDRLPGNARAAMPNAVAENLTHQQHSDLPARVPRPKYRAHERPGEFRPLRPPGNRHALPHRHHSHQVHRHSRGRPAPGGHRSLQADAQGCTLSSAANVKPQRPHHDACEPKYRPGSGYAHRSHPADAVRYMSADTGTRRFPSAQGDTPRDKQKWPA